MNTAERLQGYYAFEEGVLEAVAACAEREHDASYQDLAKAYGIGDRPDTSWPLEDDNSIQYWHIAPRTDYDNSKVRVYFAPMGNPADENMAMRGMRLFGADPSVPLMIAGNPAGIKNGGATIERAHHADLRNGDFRAAVDPVLAHLAHNKVTRIETIGFSYGADLAAEAATQAERFDILAESGVWMEPASVATRGLWHLASDFRRSEAPLEGYIAQTDSPALVEAREKSAEHMGFVRWAGGLLTHTNRSIAKGIAKGNYIHRVRSALDAQPELSATVAWGELSELSTPTKLNLVVQKLQQSYGGRLHGMELRGMHHAGGDDIDLHAAIVLQGLRNTSK